MKNSYPFFNRYKGQLSLVAMAVQQPTLTYTNPETKKPFTHEEFVAFAEDYLGVNIIFWTTESPWLGRTPERSANAAQIAWRFTRLDRSRPGACRRSSGCRHDASGDHLGHGLPRIAQPFLRQRHELRIAAGKRASMVCFSSTGSLRNRASSKRCPVVVR
jgi:hypothetical protein